MTVLLGVRVKRRTMLQSCQQSILETQTLVYRKSVQSSFLSFTLRGFPRVQTTETRKSTTVLQRQVPLWIHFQAIFGFPAKAKFKPSKLSLGSRILQLVQLHNLLEILHQLQRNFVVLRGAHFRLSPTIVYFINSGPLSESSTNGRA